MRAAVLVIAAGCTAASPDPGETAALQIPNAQFRPGGFPAASGGPAALSAVTTHASVVIGRVHEKLHGILTGDAHAAIVGIDGAGGAWIVVAGPPDFDTPGDATITTAFGLARDVEAGPFTLLVAGVDGNGQIGDAARVDLVAEPETPPDGDLVIGLAWDNAADLDLHVVDPLGDDVWAGAPNSWQPPPPGEPVDPDAWMSGGILDHDGNAACHRDGAPSEHVIWKTRTGSMGPVAPIIPPGTYTVLVDARSLCGAPDATWEVAVYRTNGELVGAARGISTIDDVDAVHGKGAGVTALVFEQ